MSALLRAAVIGGGLIGSQLDEPGASEPLTHAGGYSAAGFELVAIADCNEAARNRAKRWACAIHSDLDEAMRLGKPDVVSLAVPTSERGLCVTASACLSAPRRRCGKSRWHRRAGKARRSCDRIGTLEFPWSSTLPGGSFHLWQQLRGNSVMVATIRYAKGVRYNGTHAIDLCRMLFGNALAINRSPGSTIIGMTTQRYRRS